ncbi:hypothetical protein HAX54_027728 [Datura stramonium]|uniref:Uncharacterized protein n=1 Tax=Datura stramonium TaxID=4076 RepID=A0ABS8V5R1_DATST|nr:hypothetical protein [Datura stramonium]
MFSAVSTGSKLQAKLMKTPFLVLKRTYLILRVLMFSAGSTGTELRPKAISIPFLVFKEVVRVLNCAFAHEAPEAFHVKVIGIRFEACSSCVVASVVFSVQPQHKTLVSTSISLRVILDVLDTSRNIKPWSVPSSRLKRQLSRLRCNWLSGGKIQMDELTDSPADVEAIEFQSAIYFGTLCDNMYSRQVVPEIRCSQ